ncbi:hypothetical protein [Streptomyces sp. NBC_00470]|uniref:hypothetical protein n=1 Tax=Streptomyces sp. NBC_00470 TaxID=2975753 RepID=UPI002F909F75
MYTSPAAPADSREAARRLIEALPQPLPSDESRRADAVLAALQTSRLLDDNSVGISQAVADAARDGLTSLAHLLDEDAPDHGAGDLLLLLLADHNLFIAHPAPAPGSLRCRVRDAGTALLHLSLWHTDDQLLLLSDAMNAHAEQARAASTRETV